MVCRPSASCTFQFPPLRKGRLRVKAIRPVACLFQFPSLREGRRLRGFAFRGADISIPAPPRGATTPSVDDDAPEIFQFPPLREGRPLLLENSGIPYKFQFTPLREGRPHGQRGVFALLISIPAPPRGATVLLDVIPPLLVFQFPPLREGRHLALRANRDVIAFQFPPLREGRPDAQSA